MQKHTPITTSLLTALFLVFASTSIAQTISTCTPATTAPGSYDSCFGYESTGKVLTAGPSATNSLLARKTLLQNDGKILTLFSSGEPTYTQFNAILMRYNADGTVDNEFGQQGFVYINWKTGGTSSSPYDIALQRVQGFDAFGRAVWEERIIVVGVAPPLSTNSDHSLRVERYLPDGRVDVTFGTNGTVNINAGYAEAVAIQPWDQKIVTMGYLSVLVRLNADGTPDSTFGVGGVSQAKTNVKATAIAFQSSKKIIVVGSFTKGSTAGNDFAVARFNANGTLDTTFGNSGKALSDFARDNDGIKDVVVTADDFITVAGSASAATDTAMARYTPNGQPDATFGAGGKVRYSVGPGQDFSRSIELQSDKKIVLFAAVVNGDETRDVAVVRFNANGTLDTRFGPGGETNQGGKVITDFYGDKDEGYGVIQRGALCADGTARCERLVVAPAVRKVDADGTVTRYAAAVRYMP